MATDVRIVPGTLEFARDFAPLMREEDLEEGRALGLIDPIAALLESVRTSNPCVGVTFDGEPAVMLGVQPAAPVSLLDVTERGLLWMLSGRACSRHPKDFLRYSRRILDGLLERYDELHNVIDARYLGAVRWARWLKLELGPPEPFGPRGMLFHRFVARRR